MQGRRKQLGRPKFPSKAITKGVEEINSENRGSGYVHTNAFLFGFVIVDAENAQSLSVDTTVFIPFSRRR